MTSTQETGLLELADRPHEMFGDGGTAAGARLSSAQSAELCIQSEADFQSDLKVSDASILDVHPALL